MNEIKKKKKLKKSVVFKCMALSTSILSVIIFIMFLKLKLLPFKYLFFIFLILFIIDSFLLFLVSKKNYKFRMFGCFLSILFFILFAVALVYQGSTISFLRNISILNIQTENYSILVKKNSNYKEIIDLEGKKIAYVNGREGVSKALKKIEQEIKFNTDMKSDSTSLKKMLLEGNVDAILMESEEVKLYSEIDKEFQESMRLIKEIEVEVKKENFGKDVKITQEPFSIFVTGIDTYGALTKVSRSDVNMVITVNPLTHKILLTSIPRDYYVQIAGTTGLKDKLTHAGLKGVETSMKTIESLLDVEINYYVKINFTSLVEIIDAIEGVDVLNPFEFTADYKEENEDVYYVFLEGNIHLNGKEALAYVRERYGLREGDVARARHQQQVIKAMINKLTTTTILRKYTKILSSIEGNFATNLSLDSITGFIQKQLNEIPNWDVETLVLSGMDKSELTASFPELYSAVMVPDEESVKNAIQKINEITDK